MTSASDAPEGFNVTQGASATSNSAACPRCFEVVNPKAAVCKGCQFEILRYAENLRQCKILRMAKAPGDNHRVWLRNHYKKTKGWVWIGFVVLGILVAFVPLIGIFASPAFFLCALITLVAPARGMMFLEFVLEHRTYKENVALARRTGENTFTDVFCPSCGHCFASAKKRTIYGWSDVRQHPLKCPACGNVSQRVKNALVWVPHPSVTLTGTLDEYVPRDGSYS